MRADQSKVPTGDVQVRRNVFERTTSLTAKDVLARWSESLDMSRLTREDNAILRTALDRLADDRTWAACQTRRTLRELAGQLVQARS